MNYFHNFEVFNPLKSFRIQTNLYVDSYDKQCSCYQ